MTDPQEQSQDQEPEQPGEMPPASFLMLLTNLISQAMVCLGQIPDPVEGKSVVQIELAEYFIDTLAVLQEKTQGNLTDEESQMLEESLHQLRMLFVAVRDLQPSEL